MRISADGWIIIGLIAAAVIFALTFGSGGPQESDLSTSYSNDAAGTKAIYTLLGERLGYNVDRLHRPYNEMPKHAAVLVCVEPLEQAPIKEEEQAALNAWIRQGGTAIFVSDSLKHIPGQYRKTKPLGRGFIYEFKSRSVITNKGARDYRNTMKLLDVIAERVTSPQPSHGKGGSAAVPPLGPRGSGGGPSENGLILFDEYHHGIGRSQIATVLLQIDRRIKIGACIIALSLLALCYGRGRRFGAVRSLPARESLRPEFEFVESVARLYERSGAADLAAEILVKSLRQSLCLKLGMSSDAPRQQIVDSVRAGFGVPPARIERLLAYEQAGQKLSKAELLHIAREIHTVEKELGLVRTVG